MTLSVAQERIARNTARLSTEEAPEDTACSPPIPTRAPPRSTHEETANHDHRGLPRLSGLRQLFRRLPQRRVRRAVRHGGQRPAAYRTETGPGHRAAARAELDRLTAAPGALIRLAADLTASAAKCSLQTRARRGASPPRSAARSTLESFPRRYPIR